MLCRVFILENYKQPKSNDEMPNTFSEEYNKIKFYGELV